MSRFRGYEIQQEGGTWLFSDTRKSVAETWKERPCGHCGLKNTPEGHDGCLGTLPGVINACCGHGNTEEAYVQFPNRKSIHGKPAKILISKLK